MNCLCGMFSFKRIAICGCEVTILAVATVTVWLLMFIPTIVYFTKDEESNTKANNTSVNNISCDKNNIRGECRPHCEKWNLYSGISGTLSFVVIGVSTAIGLITTAVIITLSFLRFRNMLKFPSVMVIYQDVAVSLYGLVILVGLLDRRLFCPLPDFIQSLNEPATPLCAISGFLIIYAVLPVAVWVSMQIACILLGVYFPFRGQRILTSTWKRRSLHMIALLLGLFLPVPTVVLLWLNGQSLFGTTFPPIVCISQRRDVMIFTWLIPLSSLLSVIITMLIFIFYKVIKSKGCFSKPNKSSGITVEIKVLIIAFSYICLGLVATISFAISSARQEEVKEEVLKYFECERCGSDQKLGKSCSRHGFEDLTNSTVVTMAYSLFGLYSVITLVYVIRIADLKKCCRMMRMRCHNLRSGATMMSQMPSEDNP